MSSLNSAYSRMLPALATFVFVILVSACLYWAKPVLIPAALAILLTFLLSPVVAWLQRWRLPRAVAVILTVLAATLLIAAIGWLFTSQLMHLVDQLPRYKGNVTRRIADLRQRSQGSPFEKVDDFLEDVSAAVTAPFPGEAETSPPPIAVTTSKGPLDASAYFASAIPLLAPLGAAGLTFVLVIFMLLKREDLRNRLLRLIGQGRMVATTKALDEAGQRLSRYLLAQFCLNLGFGVFVGTGLYWIELPHALLWGILAGFLRYIPILGPWLAAILPVALSLLISEGWLQPLSVIALFATFEVLSNLVIEPLVYGQSIGVSPAVLMLAIAFWTWLWGPMGLVLAAPLTVCLAVLGKYVPQFQFLDVLLGDAPVLTAEVHFYQRLVARDLDEALEIVRQQSQALAFEQVCDRVLVPALVNSRQDLNQGALTHDDARFVVRALQEIAHEYGDLQSQATDAASQADEHSAPSRLTILACAAADEIDRVALELFVPLLNVQVARLGIISGELLVSEIVAAVNDRRPAVVLIAALPPSGLGRTRLLCKRLRSRHPDLKIVVGRWGESNGERTSHEELLTLGADYVGTSMQQSLSQMNQLAQFLGPEHEQERSISSND